MFWWISEATESVEFHKKDSMDDQVLHIFLIPVNILKDIAVSICLSAWHNLFLQLEIYSEEHMQYYKQT